MQREYSDNPKKLVKLSFFCSGDKYHWFGLIPGDNHLVCAPDRKPFYVLGTDRLGRDMLSRILQGARISLTIGLIGISVSFLLGISIGGAAGYYGGWVDIIVQRVIEVLQSIPTIPLWLTLSAIMPASWSPILIYFGITIILGLLGLDRTCPCSSFKITIAARRRLCSGCSPYWRKSSTHYRSSSCTRVYEPSDSFRHYYYSNNDTW